MNQPPSRRLTDNDESLSRLKNTLDMLKRSKIDSVDAAVPVLSTLLALAFVNNGLSVDDDVVAETACRTMLMDRPALLALFKTAHSDFSPVVNSPLFPSVVSAVARETLTEWRPAIESRAQNADLLPQWMPKPNILAHPAYRDVDVQRHLASLHLRKTWTYNTFLRIILHDLGRFKQDVILSARVERLFSPHDKLFVNAAGTGKTRLCYEGLCSNWGFYFTFDVGEDLLGSYDLPRVFQDYCRIVRGRDDRDLGFRHFDAVLLARLLVFQEFLGIVTPSVSDTLTDQHKVRWLENQLASGSGEDLYSVIGTALLENDASHLADHITDALRKIRAAIGHDAPLFIVLDEAQLACLTFEDEDSSLLERIIRSWKALTGGACTFVCPSSPLSEFTLGEDLGFQSISETGSFDDPDVHETYVQQFLPPNLRDSPSGRFLVARLWRWCRGRYRLTDKFLSILLEEGLDYPQACLSEFIRSSTDLKPLDAVEMSVEEACPGDTAWGFFNIKQFDFSELSPDHKDLVVEILYRYMSTHQGRHFDAGEHLDLVNHSYARFADAKLSQIIFDEPFVLVCAARQLFPFPSQAQRGRPHHHPATFIGSLRLNPPRTRQSLAHCVAFYVAQVFGKPRLLPDIMNFPHAVPGWARQTAQLVRLFMDEKGGIQHEAVLPDFFESSRPLATATDTLEETTRWIAHNYGTAFCIPSSPNLDLLYALQLADKSFIWVAVRLFPTDEPVTDDHLRPAISLLDIDSLFLEDEVDSTLSKRATNGLRSLPGVRQRPCVLRAVSSFPVEVDLRTSVDKRSRDLVQLSLIKLRREDDQVMQEEFFAAIVSGLIAGTKRKSRWDDAPLHMERKRARILRHELESLQRDLWEEYSDYSAHIATPHYSYDIPYQEISNNSPKASKTKIAIFERQSYY
ncbi:hypothetical protein MIND_00876500 [Mycena indigotica]|uniref:Uncharacterized protein n=1 Tax=Mycena indigotica TaxID=2126181 RepID=A0A8H6SIH5_9AGAR|nr:uncharacterized protein MIND_00876500 [Mycena indigotica]KAF7299276.1 hypothetical protein MIND_00876500 [Mycena indigotica]